MVTAPSPELYVGGEIDESALGTYFRYTDEPSEPSPATEARPVEVADRIGARVAAPSAPSIDEAGSIGPSLTVESSPVETAEKKPIQTALLPRWVRRLPAVMANFRAPNLSSNSTKKKSHGEIHYRDTSGTNPSTTADNDGPSGAGPKAEKIWPQPTSLIEQLGELPDEGPVGRWAEDVLRHIHALENALEANSDEAAAIVARLADLEPKAHKLADELPDRTTSRELRRAAYALRRRIDLWERAFALGGPQIGENIRIALDPRRLTRRLAEIESLTGDSPQGDQWRKFLMIGELKEALALGSSPNEAQLRRLARRVVARLTLTPLTPEQEDFLSRKAVAGLRDELLLWAIEPFSAADLLAEVERYERGGLPSDAQRLAMACQYLTASASNWWRTLAALVDAHYRNANFRLAVTEKLLNDLIPEQNVEYARVNDRVLGKPTYGESLMATEAVVRMQPDPRRIRMNLEVTGEISAITTSDAGLAQFYNNSESCYKLRKPLEVDLDGISLWPAEVDVYNETRLRGVETSMDRVPLFNRLFENVARSQHEQKKPAANREVRRKIAARARKRIDAEVHERFSGVVERLNRRLFEPLNSLALDPQLIDAATTETQFSVRLRLAGENQLGSHTPRPRAPRDSLASVQLHETVLNNGIDRLQLAGRTFTLSELADHIAARLNCPPPWETLPENEDVKITFARKDPVVVRCEGGQAEITLSIRRLSKSPRQWKDFQIRAYYRPVVEGRSALLVREGVLSLIGDRLTLGSQIVLRGIFSHVLAKDAPLTLVNNPVISDPRLEYAKITQFEIEDGWIGIALGPKTVVAARPDAKSH
ncbi:MAG: hypothetical protein JW959_11240 [Pirellulales bacterium]|nr:hypothetical protein [Pirellulales bacterium]